MPNAQLWFFDKSPNGCPWPTVPPVSYTIECPLYLFWYRKRRIPYILNVSNGFTLLSNRLKLPSYLISHHGTSYVWCLWGSLRRFSVHPQAQVYRGQTEKLGQACFCFYLWHFSIGLSHNDRGVVITISTLIPHRKIIPLYSKTKALISIAGPHYPVYLYGSSRKLSNYSDH